MEFFFDGCKFYRGYDGRIRLVGDTTTYMGVLLRDMDIDTYMFYTSSRYVLVNKGQSDVKDGVIDKVVNIVDSGDDEYNFIGIKKRNKKSRRFKKLKWETKPKRYIVEKGMKSINSLELLYGGNSFGYWDVDDEIFGDEEIFVNFFEEIFW